MNLTQSVQITPGQAADAMFRWVLLLAAILLLLLLLLLMQFTSELSHVTCFCCLTLRSCQRALAVSWSCLLGHSP
jgi:uncharacterized integral membrane protein